jgi:hypothetical protein
MPSLQPIADLFPETTLMFADMVGFTAWSSVREPSQVFILLETVYPRSTRLLSAEVFFQGQKKQSGGLLCRCHLGLPEPRPRSCNGSFERLCKLHRLVQRLEATLGPDTGDLSMRFLASQWPRHCRRV